MLRNGWANTETSAKDSESTFKAAEKQMLKIVLHILEIKLNVKVKLSDIDVQFMRNQTDNLLSKVQAMQAMMETGIDPKIAIAISGIFGDPAQVALDSSEYLEKWKPQNTLINTQTIPEGVTPTNNQEKPD